MDARTEKHLALAGLIARYCIAMALAATPALVLAPPTMAAGDEVKSGSFRLGISGGFAEQLSRNGVKMTPKSYAISEGSVNPLTGAGEVSLKGKLRFKRGGDRAVFRQLTATLPSEGKSGYLKGKGTRRYGLLAEKSTKLFSLRGGEVTRNGFGARIAGIEVKFLPKAAKRVNRKLGLHSLRRANAGSLAVSEQPQTVEVTGGTATAVPALPEFLGGPANSLSSKMPEHCVSHTAGNTPIAPAVKSGPVDAPTYTYPVSGGTVSPNGTDGVVNQSGGIQLANQRTGGAVAGDCDEPPPGVLLATLRQTDSAYNLLDRYISSRRAITGPPAPLGGDQGEGIGANLDLSNATVSADSDAHTVIINGIVQRINKGAALYLNQTFPQPAATFSETTQFAFGDLNGIVNMSLTTR